MILKIASRKLPGLDAVQRQGHEKQKNENSIPLPLQLTRMVGRGENRFFGLRSNASPEPDQLDSDVLNVKGLNLAKRGKLLEAILCFQKAVHLNPNNSKLWYNYGTSLTKIGKFDDSTLHCFEKAIQIDPNDAEAWNNRGSVLYALGRNREARICYERSIELAPTNGRAWRNMGVLFEKLGDKKTAKECYKRAAETRLKI